MSEDDNGEAEPETGGSDEIDADEVCHIAELARIKLEEDEEEGFVEEFNDILGYFDKLDDIPDEVEESHDLENVLRADEEKESLPQSEVLRNAAETEDGYIKGPKVS